MTKRAGWGWGGFILVAGIGPLVLFGGCPAEDTGTDNQDASADALQAETPPPVADAGEDIGMNDFNEDGRELVYFNASKSRAERRRSPARTGASRPWPS